MGEQPAAEEQGKAKEARRFQVTAVELVSQHCTAPIEKTPVSPEKQRRQEQQKQQNQQNASPSEQATPK